MLKIDGKTFMNVQEAVQWLLDNNALPFQSTANYAGNTEIGLGTIINPSPAKVRIGSLIFFADSKVSTVTGLTENGFIVSDQYNDLVDDIVYVSNVALNASGHLIVTLSNGTDIDAGLIKQVTGFSINASQHLIVNYNDGTSTDLGAIFAGNINIAGNLTVAGSINGEPTPSLKPMYWHSCTFKRITSGSPDVLVFYFDFIIINNDPTPFTLSSFMNWLYSHQDAEIKVVQGYDSANPSGMVSFFKYLNLSAITVSVVDLATGAIIETNKNATAELGTVFTDNGVNKLN